MSTPEDRRYWIAKSRLQIVDLKTKEVIAERIGYARISNAGDEAREIPWDSVNTRGSWRRSFCPYRPPGSDEKWIYAVLHNASIFVDEEENVSIIKNH